jgi:hypothetical protein
MFVATHRARCTRPRGTTFSRADDVRCGAALDSNNDGNFKFAALLNGLGGLVNHAISIEAQQAWTRFQPDIAKC